MSQHKNLVIINNEKVHQKGNSFFCDNIDMKSVPEGLEQTFEVQFIGRKTKINRSHQINLRKIKISSNLISFLFSIFRTFKNKKTNYLLVSITPYTFFAYLLLSIFRKKTFVYLRSNGYEEYKSIFGLIGPPIYHFMYIIVTFGSHVIVCQKKLDKKNKADLVQPSELDDAWLKNTTRPEINKPKLLYVGRIKIEKGIFSLIKIFNEMHHDAELSIIGKADNLNKNYKKINFLNYLSDPSELIKIYDNHNILILPSFTEAHPKVIDESLARKRPVIIFQEISHVVQNKIGVFTSERNAGSLSNTIDFIMKNYSKIQNEMIANNLPTKQTFIYEISNILK